MKRLLYIFLLFISFASKAVTPGMYGLDAIKQCVMQNNIKLCHETMTPNSYEILDKFSRYQLMPCLPTDFHYVGEQAAGDRITVRAEMPADNKTNYTFRMVFVNSDNKMKLDLPETLRTGLGENWKNKVDMSEQIFLLMKQNMKDKLTCDVLRDLAEPKRNSM